MSNQFINPSTNNKNKETKDTTKSKIPTLDNKQSDKTLSSKIAPTKTNSSDKIKVNLTSDKAVTPANPSEVVSSIATPKAATTTNTNTLLNEEKVNISQPPLANTVEVSATSKTPSAQAKSKNIIDLSQSVLNQSNNGDKTLTNLKNALSKTDSISNVQTDSTRKSLKDRISGKIKLSNKTKAIIGIVGGIIIIALALLFIWFGLIKQTPKPSSILTISSNYLSPISQVITKDSIFNVNTLLPIASEPRTEVSPINGILLTKTEYNELKNRRPIAVMIDNHISARPQKNLSKADIVFETSVESGITRYMPIYWSNAVNEVGPIRSARQYYLEFLSPYDAIYIHDGCASSSDARVNACGNLYNYNIEDIANTVGAWRRSDRYAPHNEYSSTISVWDYASQNSISGLSDNFEAWQFKKDLPINMRGTKTKVSISFWGDLSNYYGDYDVEWVYDSAANNYIRKIGGNNDIDEATGQVIRAKVVVVQEVTMTETYDISGHVIVETIGSGKTKILQDGKIYDATWEKTNRTDRTSYKGTDGKDFVFNRGLIWIEALPRDYGQFVINEQ
ncbi:MAG TPA: DUF3048 domain-containing protein [Candidatus Dojkabacteria bacterium]|nr:DUF3048 domain-containing protein [Candidatus Dojkabacteria bacterium]